MGGSIPDAVRFPQGAGGGGGGESDAGGAAAAAAAGDEERMAEMESAGDKCGICLESIPASGKRFGLLNCDHVYCLGAFRSLLVILWGNAFV